MEASGRPCYALLAIVTVDRQTDRQADRQLLRCFASFQACKRCRPANQHNIAPPTVRPGADPYINVREKRMRGPLYPPPPTHRTPLFVEVAGMRLRKEHFAALEVQLWRPGLKNELAFASRQAQNDEVSVKCSGGRFHYFSWKGSHTLWLSVGLNMLRVYAEAPPPGVVSAGTK